MGLIRIINAAEHIDALFDDGVFNMDKWGKYMSALYPDGPELLKQDVQSYLESGEYTFEKDFLPIIQAVPGHPGLGALLSSFSQASDGLDERVRKLFGCSLDVDIVLYLGLCNAAGWVTQLNARRVVLLGMEKILELGWQHQDAMYGLIYHELGHIFQDQYGTLHRDCEGRQQFIWQLFTEGVAMRFEQMLAGDDHYFHQDAKSWKTWCEKHLSMIAEDFEADLPAMRRDSQRYFGDWVNYHGYGDVGYYLGTEFVRFCQESADWMALLSLPAEKAESLWQAYLARIRKTQPCK